VWREAGPHDMIVAMTTEPTALDLGSLIQALATIVALVGVIVSFWIARRGQRQDLLVATAEAERAERAERAGAASAERAENAAALTIDTMTRMADALDRIAAQRPGRASILAEGPTTRVAWLLTHSYGHTYRLTNRGDAAAHDVQISAHESLTIRGGLRAELVGPGDTMTFDAVRSRDTTDSTITVEWSPAPGGGLGQKWRYPLPPGASRI
jgi:hypothetical protein